MISWFGKGGADLELRELTTANALRQCRMIAIFDEDGGGDVDFQEFVSGLSAFSSKGNKEQKLRFAFKVYDIDRDGYISNGELFIVLKMMVGSNLKDQQLQQIVDKTIMEADLDKDGKISFEEFTRMVETTDVSMSMTLGEFVVTLVRWPEALQRSAFQIISSLTYCPLPAGEGHRSILIVSSVSFIFRANTTILRLVTACVVQRKVEQQGFWEFAIELLRLATFFGRVIEMALMRLCNESSAVAGCPKVPAHLLIYLDDLLFLKDSCLSRLMFWAPAHGVPAHRHRADATTRCTEMWIHVNCSTSVRLRILTSPSNYGDHGQYLRR